MSPSASINKPSFKLLPLLLFLSIGIITFFLFFRPLLAQTIDCCQVKCPATHPRTCLCNGVTIDVCDYCDASKYYFYRCSQVSCPSTTCIPDGCNGNCPIGCTVSEDPDCGCADNNGCCPAGCNLTNDNDCSSVCADYICNGVCGSGCTSAQDPDCGSAGCCGDNVCQLGECTTCSADCQISDCCGNGNCDTIIGENSTNCPLDCVAPDTINPTVNSFQAVLNSNQVNISWNVTDSGGSHLKQIEIWRAPDNSGSPGVWIELSSLRQTLTTLNINSHSGSVTDTPPTGTWWYGIHAVDQAGNIGTEPNPPGPIKIIISPSTCTDGTPINTCTANPPKYCNSSANLVDNCTLCGCTGSWVCGPSGTFCCDNQCNGTCSIAGCTASEDPDCSPSGCCGDGNCNIGENNTNCPADCACTPTKTCADYPGQCDTNLFDGCTNSLDCSANCVSPQICCSGTCQTPACNNNSDCDDNNSCTTDTCNNPNTCTASCNHNPITTCADNDGCCPTGCSSTNDNDCSPTCIPDGCNGNCPIGCTVSEDPDCGCADNNGCCGQGCNSSNDNDCAATCTENWTCTAWSDCIAGKQTRICTDSNNCGTENNKPPEEQMCLMVSIVHPDDGYNYIQGDWVNFDVSVLGGAPPYTFQWTSDKQGNFSTEQQANIDISSWSIGAHFITVTVTDSQGLTAADSINININPAGTLIANIQMWQTEFARDPTRPANFGVSVTGGTSPYTFQWTSDKEGNFSTDQWASVDVSSWQLGIHHITVTVTDSNGNITSDTIDIVVADMVVDVTPWNGEHFYFKDDVWFGASVSGGTAPYTYKWESDLDGIFRNEGPKSDQWDSFSVNSLSQGAHIITFSLSDNSGLNITKQIQIQIDPIDPSQVECFNFSDCDDGDPCTDDICHNPGLMSSSCSNPIKTICQDNDNCCPEGCNNSNDNDCAVTANNDDPTKVLVIYNDACANDRNKNGVKDYKEIALYYQQKRNIPDDNMLAVYPNQTNWTHGCGTYYALADYSKFLNEVVEPIKNKLNALGENNIYYLLLVGLPYTINVDKNQSQRSLDQSLVTIHDISDLSSNYPYYWGACLSSYYCESYYNTSLSKPHFNHSFKYAGDNMFLVTRIQNKDLIDRALYGEKYIYNSAGYYHGLAYVDTRYDEYSDDYLDNNYPTFTDASSYAKGDRKMAYGKRILDDIGWNYKWEATGKEIGESGAVFTDGSNATIADNAMWYEGWYNFMAYHNVWTWLPGAGACDLNSNSGSMSGTSFLRGAFENGLTVGVGVTGEPYLTGHPQPEVFLYYILHGYNFAEASNLSYPGFKWRDIAYGDPIYNPNKPKTPIKDTVSPTLTQVYSITDNDHSTSSVSIIARIDQNTTMPEVATFKIEYGLDANYGNVIDFDEIYTMEKVFAIDNLSPGITYHYKIYAKDPVGNITTSPDQTFKTMLDSTDIAPALNLSASAQIGDVPFTVNFDFSSSPMPTTYEWNFDNRDTSSVKNPTYTFNNKSVYRVILFAKFANGSTNIGELLIIAK